MDKYTQGPWVSEYPIVNSALGSRLIKVTEYECATYKDIALISAAPEMLELLVELIDMEGPQPGNCDWSKKVRSVISKATGEDES